MSRVLAASDLCSYRTYGECATSHLFSAFSEHVHDSLRLWRVPGLNLKSSELAWGLRNRREDPTQIEKALNADATIGLQCFEVDRDGRQKPVGIYLKPVQPAESDSIRSRFPSLLVSGPIKRSGALSLDLNPRSFQVHQAL